MKMKTNYGFKIWPSVKSKDDPVPSQKMTQCQVKTKVFLVKPQGPGLPTKVSFKGGSHLGNLNTFFLSSFSNLGDEISFKGGSL
jgi:hypothetical protein